MTKKRILAYLLVALVGGAALALAAAEVPARIYRRRAEQLLHEIRQLQVGKSTFEDARAVIVGHGGGIDTDDPLGCGPAHCTFEVALNHYPLFMEVWGRFLNIKMVSHVVRVLPRLGLQDGRTRAGVRVAGGFVTHLGYAVFARGSGGWVLGHDAEEYSAEPKYLRERMGQGSYYVEWFNITTEGGGEGIQSSLTPQANAEERNRAYDLDFDCLTKLGGCTSLCQIAPSSFADLVKDSHGMPWLDEDDPHCAKFKPLKGKPNDAAHP